jgi:hypothetical protein
MAPSRPPTPQESARISPAEAVARFGARGGIRLLEAEYLDQAGVTTERELSDRRRTAYARVGVAYQEPEALPRAAPAKYGAPRWLCPNCKSTITDPASPYCPSCEGGDDWARPPA